MPGRAPSFSEVYEAQVDSVYAFFAYRVRREEAEDLTQLTFERALRAWARYDWRRAAPRTWLLAIARNLLIDHYRDRRRGEESLETAPEAALGAVEEEPSLGLAPEISDALDSLGGRERELLALRFGGDLSGPEIAQLTGLSLANVQQILSRTLRQLHAVLVSDLGRREPEQRKS